MIKIYTLMNKYNYTIYQVKIDFKNKTIEKGNFSWPENKTTKKHLKEIIDLLLNSGFKMINK